MADETIFKKLFNGNSAWKVAVVLTGASVVVFQIISFAQAQGDRSTAAIREDVDNIEERCEKNDDAVVEIQRDVETIKTEIEYIGRDIKEIKETLK